MTDFLTNLVCQMSDYIYTKNKLTCICLNIPCEYIATAPWECVRVLLAEHVSHTAARNDFQRTAALPDSKRDFCLENRHGEKGKKRTN